jgi:hypothetical protein
MRIQAVRVWRENLGEHVRLWVIWFETEGSDLEAGPDVPDMN